MIRSRLPDAGRFEKTAEYWSKMNTGGSPGNRPFCQQCASLLRYSHDADRVNSRMPSKLSAAHAAWDWSGRREARPYSAKGCRLDGMTERLHVSCSHRESVLLAVSRLQRELPRADCVLAMTMTSLLRRPLR